MGVASSGAPAEASSTATVIGRGAGAGRERGERYRTVTSIRIVFRHLAGLVLGITACWRCHARGKKMNQGTRRPRGRETRAGAVRIADIGPATRARRVVRAAALGLAGILAGSSMILGTVVPASAADGDYTVELQAPASVPVGQSFNYTATLDFEGPAATHSGIVLTTTLPVGTAFESCPIGGSSPIASCSYDAGTRALTITLNDTDTDPLSVAYTVRQEPYDDRYEGEVLATSITGAGGPSGPVT